MILKGLNSANLDAIVTNMGMINKRSEMYYLNFSFLITASVSISVEICT